MAHELHCGDCLDILPTLPANSVDAIVCDPPYGLSFMGKHWDHGVPGVAFWEAALRVAKPGAMLLAFGGTRTFHRLTVAIEDAGWEIRDCLTWLYGSGFPKSLDISKAIDKAAGAERKVIGYKPIAYADSDCWGVPNKNDDGEVHHASSYSRPGNIVNGERPITAPATDTAISWAGWGTALKPAAEMIVRAIKPFPECTERDIIVGNLCQKEAQLWLLLHVSIVGRSSKLSQAELDEVLSIAQWSADKLTSTRDALCGQMDTSQFASMVNTCLSIVTSWKNMLADLWSSENTSTISTASSLTIDLKTLSYLLSVTTLEDIIQAEMQAPGSRLSALPAAKFLNAVEANISSTRMLSALGSATYGERTKRLDATADPTPAWEPIIMAMKPLDGTFANNALTHGVAGLNVDACRIGSADDIPERSTGLCGASKTFGQVSKAVTGDAWKATQGRWPANLILDEEAAAMLDEQSGMLKSGDISDIGPRANTDSGWGMGHTRTWKGDTGGASRFFYVAKASKSDREQDNNHPTVKPTQLMRYLCRMVTRPGGVILDPFMGSGSTGKAAMLEGFNFIGIELDAEYLEIAKRRIEHAQAQPQVQAQPLLFEVS